MIIEATFSTERILVSWLTLGTPGYLATAGDTLGATFWVNNTHAILHV